MKEANFAGIGLGSPVYAAKRAADILAILCANDQLEDQALLDELNRVLRVYDEQRKVVATDLNSLRVVARRLYAVFKVQETETAAILLNALLHEYASIPRLSAHDGTAWHLHIDSSDHASWSEWFISSSAIALATLLAEKQRNPGGLCGSPNCGKPFIDLGKGGGRTYCSPTCASRERVTKHRAKRATKTNSS